MESLLEKQDRKGHELTLQIELGALQMLEHGYSTDGTRGLVAIRDAATSTSTLRSPLLVIESADQQSPEWSAIRAAALG